MFPDGAGGILRHVLVRRPRVLFGRARGVRYFYQHSRQKGQRDYDHRHGYWHQRQDKGPQLPPWLPGLAAFIPGFDGPELEDAYRSHARNRRLNRSKSKGMPGSALRPIELIGETVTVKELDRRYKVRGSDVKPVIKRHDTKAESKEGREGWGRRLKRDGAFGTFADSKGLAKFVRGVGAYGQVVKAIDSSGQPVAVKIISEDAMPFSALATEVSALQKARKHPNVNELMEVLYCRETGSFYIVTSFCSGGELFDHLIDNGPYSESKAALIVDRVASALRHIHATGYAHMDVKPENLLFVSGANDQEQDESEGDRVRLIDFGMALSLESFNENGVTTIANNVGTTPYLAPEVLRGLHFEKEPVKTTDSKNAQKVRDPSLGKWASASQKGRRIVSLESDPRACDMFALGLVLYIMLVGCHPFDRTGDAQDDVIARRAVKGGVEDPGDESLPREKRRFTFDVHDSIRLSSGAKNLIRGLLNPDPNERFTARDVLKDKWVRNFVQAEHARLETATAVPSAKFEETHRTMAVTLLTAILAQQARIDSESKRVAIETAPEALIAQSVAGRAKDDQDEGDGGKARSISPQLLHNAYDMIGTKEWGKMLSRAGGSDADFEDFKSALLGAHAVSFKAGDVMFFCGDQVDGMYIILDGVAQVEYERRGACGSSHAEPEYDLDDDGESKSEEEQVAARGDNRGSIVGELWAGDLVGETGVLDGRDQRNATVRCSTPLKCLFWPRDDFVRTVGERPANALCHGIEEQIRTRQNARARDMLLRTAGISFTERGLSRGDTLYKQEDNSEELFLVLDGIVQTSATPSPQLSRSPQIVKGSLRDFLVGIQNKVAAAASGATGKPSSSTELLESPEDGVVILRSHKAGDLLGADALTKSPRMATAICLEQARLLAISRDELERLFVDEFSLQRNLLRLSRRDMEEKQAKLREIPSPQNPQEESETGNQDEAGISVEENPLQESGKAGPARNTSESAPMPQHAFSGASQEELANLIKAITQRANSNVVQTNLARTGRRKTLDTKK